MQRVVVVGGGIAGAGAAWALQSSGVDVHLIEREPSLGGNAKTHRWQTEAGEVQTGVSVLAWPPAYFRHYERLMAHLGVACEATPPLRYLIDQGGSWWAHGVPSPAWDRHAPDLARWEQLVAWVRRFNIRFHGDGPPSLYAVSWHNPLNLVPLRWLCRRFGIADAFWHEVFVPIHSSSFLTFDLDGLPAVIAPSLDDIVSLARGGTLRTWSGCSSDVFDRMTSAFTDQVHLGSAITRVERGLDEVRVHHTGGPPVAADAVVLACPAPAALAALDTPTWAERALLGGVRYPEGHTPPDDAFLTGVLHSDAARLPPGAAREFCNAVTCRRDGARWRYENTFIVSSWVPAARGTSTPMLVTYGRRTPFSSEQRRIDNRGAHPSLTTGNLLRAFALRALQGRRRTWYCGAWTTPGNGHDLSLLSGLVVAHALGAPHPFPDDPACIADFDRLRGMMLGR